jgi:dTDP-4-dehydrorhamnose 3,5-epimerase
MKFIATELAGAWIVEPEPASDARGFFARTFCAREFQEHSLEAPIAQSSISFNHRRATLRGIHYQRAPFAEAKLVRCTTGRIYDVIVDLRPESASFGRWIGIELSAANRRMAYISPGLGHGFQTLEDASEVFYQISTYYAPDYARGVRWNDPAFAIEWPLPRPILSNRDRGYPDFIR